MRLSTKNFFAACSVLIGTCIGAGFLGIPYVASKSGFLIAVFYILFLGGILLLVNLYLGETALRTKKFHQLTGYAKKYVGKKAGKLMNFAFIFGMYSAIVAYITGVSESFSYLIFGDMSYSLIVGILFGIFVSLLLWKGIKALKKYEKIGVIVIFCLLSLIFILFIDKVIYSNLNYINYQNFLIPFGVVLFALISSSAVPIASNILKKDKDLLKKSIITSSIVSIIFYILFTFIVIGFSGGKTPEIATFALGSVFIVLGIFTMFNSNLSLGNALIENFEFDSGIRKKKSWILASITPLIIYIILHFFPFFSFTKILSIGGVISGGLIAILSLFIVKGAKEKGERIPEYSVPINWFLIVIISAVFVIGIIREILSIFTSI